MSLHPSVKSGSDGGISKVRPSTRAMGSLSIGYSIFFFPQSTFKNEYQWIANRFSVWLIIMRRLCINRKKKERGLETHQQWEMMSKVRDDEHSCHCRVPLSVPATAAATASADSCSAEIGRARFVMVGQHSPALVMMQEIHEILVRRSEHEIRMTGARQLRSGRHFGRPVLADIASAETSHRSGSVAGRRRRCWERGQSRRRWRRRRRKWQSSGRSVGRVAQRAHIRTRTAGQS